MLTESNKLYHHQQITHRYPYESCEFLINSYDWRAKTPVIFRLTPQWFINTKQITQDGGILDQLKVSFCFHFEYRTLQLFPLLPLPAYPP